MATTFFVFELGFAPTIDTVEGNLTSENHNALNGLTFGSLTDPVAGDLRTLSPSPTSGPGTDGDATSYNPNNSVANEQFLIDGGAPRTFDAMMTYTNTVITYTDGTTAVVSAQIMQDASGRIYLVPSATGPTAYTDALGAKPIASVTLGTAQPANGTEVYGMFADRYVLEINDGTVEGTGGNELIDGNYAGDPEGDRVDSTDNLAGNDDDLILAYGGDDVVLSGAGDDTIDAGSGADLVAGGGGSDSIDGGAGDDLILGDGPSTVDAVLVAHEDFTGGATGWTNNTTSSGSSLGEFLGRFEGTDGDSSGGPLTERTFDLTDGYNAVVVEFDLYLIDSWDADNANVSTGPDGDAFQLYVNGEQIANELFHRNNSAFFGDRTGTVNIGGVDFTYSFVLVESGANLAFGVSDEQIWRVRLEAENYTADQITIGFGSTTNEDVENESFGIDNLSIASTNDTSIDLGGAGGDLILGDGPTTVDAIFVAHEDFTGGATGWTNNTTSNDGLFGEFLGRFEGTEGDSSGGPLTARSFELADGYNAVVIEFDLLIIDSWDADTAFSIGPDRDAFQLYINGQQVANELFQWDEPAFFGDRSGTITIDGVTYSYSFTMTQEADLGFDAAWDDQVWRVRLEADNYTADQITIGFGSTTDQGLADESFGIDNLTIVSTNDTSIDIADAAGDDVLLGGDGNDTIDGGLGDDSVWGGDGADSITGGSGNDVLSGNTGADTIDGGDGADQIQGGQGGDTLAGGAGNDFMLGDGQWYRVQDYASVSNGASTNLTVTNGADGPIELWWINQNGSLEFYATIQPGATHVQSTFADHNWVLRDEQGFYLDLIEGAPNQTVTYGAEGMADSIEGGDGSDTIHGQFGNDTIDGGGDGDLILAGTGDDSVRGGDGDDNLFGGLGADTLDGGTGNDTLIGGDGNDLFLGSAGADSIDGGATWWDIVSYSGSNEAVTVNLSDTLAESGGHAEGDRLTNIEQVIGSNFDDMFTASASGTAFTGADGNDTFVGGAGSDMFWGEAGDDVFYTSGGPDLLEGQQDADTFIVSNGFGRSTITGGDDVTTGINYDTIDLSAVTNPVNVLFNGTGSGTITDTVTGIAITFSGIERLILTEAADVVDATADGAGIEIVAAGGNDTISGGSGNDTIDGGLGDDNIASGAGSDSVTGGDGADRIDAGTGSDTVDAGAGNDTIFGWTGNDSLTGGDGNDQIFGQDGNDTILGGAGADMLDGDDSVGGADSILGDAGNDTLIGDAGNDTLRGGADDDQIFGGADDDSIEGGTGNDLIYGETGNDLIEADAGDDTIDGGDGNDTIFGFEGNDSVLGGAGDDVINTRTSPGTGLPDEEFPFAYPADTDPSNDTDFVDGGTGNDLILTGDDDDTILGGDGADTIDAGFDDDLVMGGTGADRIEGNEGNDTIDGGADGDVIYGDVSPDNPDYGVYARFELPNNGTDLAPTNNADVLSGGDGDDTIYGQDDNDTLEGGLGDDLLDGGIDDDRLFGDVGADTLIGGLGNDLLDGGDGADVLIGGTGDDTLLAGNDASADSLDGGDGNDQLSAGGGDDTLRGGAGNDSLFAAEGADILDGGTGDDTLDGWSGDDLIEGGTGNDQITGGDGNDTFVYTVGDGLDTITDFNFGNSGTLDDGISGNTDFIDLSAFYDNIAELQDDFADDGILNQSNSGNTVWGQTVDYTDNTSFDTDGIAGNEGIVFAGQTPDGTSFTQENTGVICFTPGTLILTETGECPVEDLRPGDRIVTRDNGLQTLQWLAHRHIGAAELRANDRLRPVLIQPQLIGAETPLLVSPQHGVLLRSDNGDETLVRAIHLARRPGSKARVARGIRKVTYIHLMFDAHQIIFANGAPTESFYPGALALAALSDPAREELRLLFPALFTGSAEAVFGAKARPFARGRGLPPILHDLRAA